MSFAASLLRLAVTLKQQTTSSRSAESAAAIHKFLQRGDPFLFAPSALDCRVVL
jgi:hypothetical protein